MFVDFPPRVLNGDGSVVPTWIPYHVGIFLAGMFVIFVVFTKVFGNIENWTKRQRIITSVTILVWLVIAFPIALTISKIQVV